MLAFQYFIISVSCFVGAFAGFLKIISRGWGLSLYPGGGEFAPQKISPGVCPGDGQAWN